jgi:hypothetical protein
MMMMMMMMMITITRTPTGLASFSAGLSVKDPTGFPWTCLLSHFAILKAKPSPVLKPQRNHTKSDAKTLLHLRYKML